MQVLRRPPPRKLRLWVHSQGPSLWYASLKIGDNVISIKFKDAYQLWFEYNSRKSQLFWMTPNFASRVLCPIPRPPPRYTDASAVLWAHVCDGNGFNCWTTRVSQLTCRMWWFSKILLQLRSSGRGSCWTSAFDRILRISLTLTIWQTHHLCTG